MSKSKYYHIRTDFNNINLFDNEKFSIDENFINFRTKAIINPSSVPYNTTTDTNLLNEKIGYLGFLDNIVNSNSKIDLECAETKRRFLETINYNSYFLNSRYWEKIFEEVRSEYFNHLPSRSSCIFLSEGHTELNFWIDKLTTQTQASKIKIYEVEIEAEKILKVDSNILELGILSDINIVKQAHLYWKGEKSKNPEMENLYCGDVKIINEYNSLREIEF